MSIAIPTLKLDFASPQTTITSFAEVDDALTAALGAASEALLEKQLAYDKTRDARELEIRSNAAVKVTEGYVSTSVGADPEVSALLDVCERAKLDVASIKTGIASLERKHSLYKYWLASQRPVGLD